RTIGWTLVDGDGITGGGSDTASFTTTVSVASVNSAPVLAGLDLLAIAFEGDVPVAIDPCVDFSDAEGNFNGGTLVVSGVIAEDRIGIDNVGTNPGEISVAGADISYGGTVIGSFTGGEGADLMITFNADATSEAIDTLIESLTYQNLSDNPTLVHFLSITITDAGGATNGFSEVPAVDDPFAGITVTGPASPTFLDLDADGDADLLVGSGDGTIHAYANDNGTLVELTGPDNPVDGAAFGYGHSLASVDVDGDGWLDVLV